MQPDTTPLKMAKDITDKLNGLPDSQPSNERPQNSDSRETDTAKAEPTTDASPRTTAAGSQIQVVPLYTPEDSAIKFFCVHPSHRYAMSLVPISTGFQGQVNSTQSSNTEIVRILGGRDLEKERWPIEDAIIINVF